jgi:cell division septation protein DedD
MKTEDNLGPDLQGFQKENPFRVPDGYFDRFPLKMSERIAEQKKQSRFHFHSLFKPVPLFATAAVLVAVGVIAFNLLSSSKESLTQEEISNYVYQEDIIDEFTDDDILEYAVLSTTNADTSSQNSEVEEIQDYLLDQGLDESDIINEL